MVFVDMMFLLVCCCVGLTIGCDVVVLSHRGTLGLGATTTPNPNRSAKTSEAVRADADGSAVLILECATAHTADLEVDTERTSQFGQVVPD